MSESQRERWAEGTILAQSRSSGVQRVGGERECGQEAGGWAGPPAAMAGVAGLMQAAAQGCGSVLTPAHRSGSVDDGSSLRG